MELDREGTLCVELEPAANNRTVSETGPDYLDELVQATGCRAMREPARLTGVVLGTLAAWDDAGNPLVDFPGNPWSCFLTARSTVPLSQAAVGKEVALLFVEGDLRRPLVVGLVQTPAGEPC